MKRNYIQFTIYTVSMMLTLISCQKVLETQPYDKISEDVVWGNKANAETFIYATYGIMNNFNFGPNTDGRTTNLLSMDGTYNAFGSIFTETTDRNSNIGGFSNFGTIRRCNQIIEKVGTSPGIAEDDKKVLIAEGKFLRGMAYYQVARNVGRICWIDKVLKPEDSLKLASTKNPTESYNYIIKDLEDAVAGLGTTKIPGRVNKYVAAAYLSQICLQAAAYKNYPAAPAIAANDPLIDKAIANANLVINEGGYTMDQNYGGMFNEVNPGSSEIIYAVYRKALNTNSESTPMQNMVANFSNDQINNYGGSPLLSTTFRVFEAWIEHAPTYNLAQDYLVIDKADPTKAVAWDKTSQYLNAVSESTTPTADLMKQNNETYVKVGVINPGSHETTLSLSNENRDARYAQTFVTDSAKLFGEFLTTCIKGNATRWMKISGFAWYTSLSNMYWRKGIYNNIQPRVYYGVPTDYHFVSMRLGRVYLNLAEAYLLKGDLVNALLNMNKTRVIHGKLPPSTATTLAEAWKDYKRERRVELVLEDDYYFSLLRWGRYGGDANGGLSSGGIIPELTQVPLVMDIAKNRKSFSVVQGTFYGSNNIRVFNEQRRYLFPIPQGQIDNNSNFGPQNPGW